LSASRIAINETSGKSRPSRRRLIPIKTSILPERKSFNIFGLSNGLISECKYLVLIFWFCRKVDKSSAEALVKVKTKVLSWFLICFLISLIKSGI
jgi:hypothetical protein